MKRWTEKEINYLKENYSNKLNRELSKELKRSDKSIKWEAYALKLKKDKEFYAKSRKKTEIIFNKEDLERRYFNNKKSVRQIAKEMKVGKTTIEHYFKKFNIKRRPQGEASKLNPPRSWNKGLNKSDPRIVKMALITKKRFYEQRNEKINELEKRYRKPFKQIIYDLYWVEKLSQEQIAKKLNFDRRTIIDRMRDFEINKRPNFEYISSLKGEKHPLFGKTWEEVMGKEKAHLEKEKSAIRFRELTIRRLQKNEFPFFDTQIEILMAKGLLNRNIAFVKQFRINNFVCDLAIPCLKIAIECDGDYWHANPKIYFDNLTKTQIKRVATDKIKNETLKKEGWTLLRFYESDIKSNINECLDKIQQAVEKNIHSPIDDLMS